MSDVESKKASELSGNSQDQLLPFPSTRPDSELIGNSKSSDDSSIKPNTGAKTALPRRSRAGTMPSSYNASSLVYIPPNRGGGQGQAYQGQRSTELHGASQNSPAHILRARGATLSGSSINTGFGSNMLTSWRDIRSPLSSKPLVSLDESEQSIARTLDCLGLDDIETSRLPPQPQGVSALRNANRVRSRTFTAALHYAESPVNAVPAPPAQKRTVYPKSYNRARAISMGFLDPTDSIPELDAIMGEDDAYDFFDAYEHDEEGYSPSRALWIGNLDPAFGSADLMALFAPYGPIESLRVIPEKECAFINFMYLEDAVVAKADLSGGTIGNNVIRIGFSRVDSALGEMQASAPTRALWIGNISASTSSAMLQTIFSNFGIVESARVLSHKNCGFVNFERTEDAVKARKAMNGQEISGSVVRIGFAKVPPRGESGSKSTRTIPAVPLSVMGIPSAPWSSEDAPEPEEVKAVSPTTVSPTVRFAPDLNGIDTELSIIDKGLLLSLDDKLLAFPYASYLPPLPDSSHIKLDQNRLREIRKRLDSHPNPKDIENAFNELEPVFVELCTDYIGNTVIQKLMDKGNEAQRLRLIEKVAPFLAPIGVHKNGTWAVQKIIDSATTPAQIHHVINYLKPFVPPLMLDQFGNYVIQGCLKYGPEYNQFIYDAIHSRCWEICQGRFGARAVRTCLESNFVSKRQQRLVSVALAHSSLLLSTDPNGSLLLTWLLDTSNIYGRFKALVPQFSLHLPQLCTHKLATLTILKIINQRFEPDARSELIKSLFFSSDSVLEIVLGDQAHGMGLIQKILASACIEEDEREKIVERVREAAIKLELNQIQGYHHFMEQLGVPTSPSAINWQSTLPSANNGTSPDSPRIDQQQQA